MIGGRLRLRATAVRSFLGGRPRGGERRRNAHRSPALLLLFPVGERSLAIRGCRGGARVVLVHGGWVRRRGLFFVRLGHGNILRKPASVPTLLDDDLALHPAVLLRVTSTVVLGADEGMGAPVERLRRERGQRHVVAGRDVVRAGKPE